MPRPLPSRGVLPRPSALPRGTLLALAVVLSACDRGGGGQVTFALSGPLRQDYGASTLRGAELAVKEINASNGIGGR